MPKLAGDFGTLGALVAVKITSSAVNLLPSCHLTSFLNLNSHVVSLIGFQEVARSGIVC